MRRKKRGERYIDRWRKAHPEVRFYLDRDTYDKLKALADRENTTIKELCLRHMQGILSDMEEIRKESYEKGYKKGYEDGYEKSKKEYRIWYYCNVCGREITMYPNRNDHKSMIEYMKLHGWGHKICHENLRKL